MCVEQQLTRNSNKSFVLLLHYSPSSSLKVRTYPALFLGGWEHIFLDSVGYDSSTFEVDRFIALACSGDEQRASDKDDRTSSLCSSIHALLPRVLPHLASQTLLYRNQGGNESFRDRKRRLDSFMYTKINNLSIGQILCHKFAVLWMEKALWHTTRRSAEALLNGTTQLSLSLSVHSFLLQTFQSFLGDILMHCNQWMNLDVLNESGVDVLTLFGSVLLGFPV